MTAPADNAAPADIAALSDASASPEAQPPATEPLSADDSDEQDNTGDDDAQDDQHDDTEHDDGPDNGRAARQAASYRRQLRAAEDSLVAANAALGLQQQAIVDAAIVAAGFDPQFARLLETTAGLADLTDDHGLIDAAKVRDAIRTTAQTFGVAPKQRPPAPTPGQGRPNGTASAGWSSLLGDAARGRL